MVSTIKHDVYKYVFMCIVYTVEHIIYEKYIYLYVNIYLRSI